MGSAMKRNDTVICDSFFSLSTSHDVYRNETVNWWNNWSFLYRTVPPNSIQFGAYHTTIPFTMYDFTVRTSKSARISVHVMIQMLVDKDMPLFLYR